MENDRPIPAPPEAVAVPVPSNAIAVVPFEDLNLEGRNGFGTSVRHAIETHLQSTDSITTTARLSDARYLINGAIQHIGPMARVTARIVDTTNDASLEPSKSMAVRANKTISNQPSQKQSLNNYCLFVQLPITT
ncbi:MAG: hypothetical protein CM1200mP25_5030 [Acidobacteriota bacterium]|nr:MAG: hypothetical protein CM1200mP25_5030 [Acidobacteriota bacterium]